MRYGLDFDLALPEFMRFHGSRALTGIARTPVRAGQRVGMERIPEIPEPPPGILRKPKTWDIPRVDIDLDLR
jgi:hypothetical protein